MNISPAYAEELLRSGLSVANLALYESDPLGDSARECGYVGYDQVPVDGKFNISGMRGVLDADIKLPKCTSGATVIATHFAIVEPKTGKIRYAGGLVPNIVIAPGTTPVVEKDTIIEMK